MEMTAQQIAPTKFIIQIPMYQGRGRSKRFSCFYYATGFSWRDMSSKTPNKLSYGPDRSKAVLLGKLTAEERLQQFRIVGEVIPA